MAMDTRSFVKKDSESFKDPGTYVAVSNTHSFKNFFC